MRVVASLLALVLALKLAWALVALRAVPCIVGTAVDIVSRELIPAVAEVSKAVAGEPAPPPPGGLYDELMTAEGYARRLVGCFLGEEVMATWTR